MSELSLFNNLLFHDSTLDAMRVDNWSVVMEFEDVGIRSPATEDRDEPLIGVKVVLTGVTHISEDGAAVDTLRMRGEFGDVMGLEQRESEIRMTLYWFRPGQPNIFSTILFSGPSPAIVCEPRLSRPD